MGNGTKIVWEKESDWGMKRDHGPHTENINIERIFEFVCPCIGWIKVQLSQLEHHKETYV